jgi:hypothetical protein
MYWAPRLIIIGIACSMPFSTPGFIAGMGEGEFMVWFLRLMWVLAFPAGFCLVLGLVLAVKKIRQTQK